MDIVKQHAGGIRELGKANPTSAIDAGRSAFTFGVILGLWHLGWAAIVAAGIAQPVINFIYSIHFIEPNVTIRPFDLSSAFLLVASTTIGGFVFGYLFALIWNRISDVHK